MCHEEMQFPFYITKLSLLLGPFTSAKQAIFQLYSAIFSCVLLC